jgi:hypothetical protein
MRTRRRVEAPTGTVPAHLVFLGQQQDDEKPVKREKRATLRPPGTASNRTCYTIPGEYGDRAEAVERCEAVAPRRWRDAAARRAG